MKKRMISQTCPEITCLVIFSKVDYQILFTDIFFKEKTLTGAAENSSVPTLTLADAPFSQGKVENSISYLCFLSFLFIHVVALPCSLHNWTLVRHTSVKTLFSIRRATRVGDILDDVSLSLGTKLY